MEHPSPPPSRCFQTHRQRQRAPTCTDSLAKVQSKRAETAICRAVREYTAENAEMANLLAHIIPTELMEKQSIAATISTSRSRHCNAALVADLGAPSGESPWTRPPGLGHIQRISEQAPCLCRRGRIKRTAYKPERRRGTGARPSGKLAFSDAPAHPRHFGGMGAPSVSIDPCQFQTTLLDKARPDFGHSRPGVGQTFAVSVEFGTNLANCGQIWPRSAEFGRPSFARARPNLASANRTWTRSDPKCGLKLAGFG